MEPDSNNLECNLIQQFAGTHDARHTIRRVRKITLVAGDDVIGLCEAQKFRVGRIGGNGPRDVQA
jgi:hypothetical protein